MKIAVVGAGAVGGYLAGSLAKAGAEVGVVVRGEQLRAISERGLTVREDDSEFTVRLEASDRAADLGQQDVVLVAVKSHALTQAAPQVAALLGPETAVVFLQNGIPWWYYHGIGGATEGRRLPAIDPGDVLWNTIGPQRAIAGTTSSACTLLAPGVVEAKGGKRLMVLGEPDGTESARVNALAVVLREAGFPLEVTTNIRDKVWTKLALNLGSGPFGVLAPVPLKEMFAEPALIDARMKIFEEVTAIAKAMGYKIEIDAAASNAFVKKSMHLPSIAQDALAKRKLEIETMFLEPLRMAREHGVPTPMLDLLVALATMNARVAGLYP